MRTEVLAKSLVDVLCVQELQSESDDMYAPMVDSDSDGDMMAVEELIGEVVSVELFEDSVCNRKSEATEGNIPHEELEVAQELTPAEDLAHTERPGLAGILALAGATWSTELSTKAQDFISIEGYTSDEELDILDDTTTDGHTSMSSEESVLTEPVRIYAPASSEAPINALPSQESMDFEPTIVEVVEVSLEEPLSVRERLKASWNRTKRLSPHPLAAPAEAINLPTVEEVNAKLDVLIPELCRRQATAPYPSHPALTQYNPAALVAPPPSSVRPNFKRTVTFQKERTFRPSRLCRQALAGLDIRLDA